MTCDEQLAEWLKGNSIHNADRDECCPDFSCCRPELLADEATRRAFVEHPEARDQMLMVFLGAGLAKMTEKAVHVAGDMPVGEPS
jgi:hypothetical protein